MNLKERFNIVFLNYPDLNIKAKNTNNGHHQLSNLHALRNALTNLQGLELFSLDVKEISENLKIFITGGDAIVLTDDEYRFLQRKVSDIQSKSRYIIEFFSSDLETGDDVLEIKLPPDTTSFDELSKVSDLLKKAFQLPVFSAGIEDSKVEIISAEPGSVWLIVKFGAALSFIAKLINKAIYVNNEMQKSTANEIYLKQIGVENDQLNQMRELAIKHVQAVTEAQAKEVLDGTIKANDPEVIRTMQIALEAITQLQERGAKFLPASKDPNVINLFSKEETTTLAYDPAKQIQN